MIQEIISNVVTCLTEEAHALEVLHRVHPSALLIMDTCRKLWGVSINNKNITVGTWSMSTEQMTLSWTGSTLVALTEEKLIPPFLTINQGNFAKKIQISHAGYLFEHVFRPKKMNFGRVKCNVLQTIQVIKMMSDTWRGKVPLGKQSAKRRC